MYQIEENPLSAEFKIPTSVLEDNYVLKQLTVSEARLDFEAIQANEEHLVKQMGNWPTNQTFESNFESIKKHEEDWNRRFGFTYTVLSKDKTQCLGCVYLYSIKSIDYDAICYFWTTEEMCQKGFDHLLFERLQRWVVQEWPFQKVVYPGWTVTLNEWTKLLSND